MIAVQSCTCGMYFKHGLKLISPLCISISGSGTIFGFNILHLIMNTTTTTAPITNNAATAPAIIPAELAFFVGIAIVFVVFVVIVVMETVSVALVGDDGSLSSFGVRKLCLGGTCRYVVGTGRSPACGLHSSSLSRIASESFVLW